MHVQFLSAYVGEETGILILCVCQLLGHVRLFEIPWSPPGSSVHGILWARILEWVAISFSILILYI